MAINSVAISGNLTRDAELTVTPLGMQVLRFTVAVNERKQNKQTGEWEDYPNFVDCTMLGNRAEKVSQYLTKGTKIAANGKLHFSQWERDGLKRSKLDVTVNEIEFLSRGNTQPQQPAAPMQDLYSADIPF